MKTAFTLLVILGLGAASYFYRNEIAAALKRISPQETQAQAAAAAPPETTNTVALVPPPAADDTSLKYSRLWEKLQRNQESLK